MSNVMMDELPRLDQYHPGDLPGTPEILARAVHGREDAALLLRHAFHYLQDCPGTEDLRERWHPVWARQAQWDLRRGDGGLDFFQHLCDLDRALSDRVASYLAVDAKAAPPAILFAQLLVSTVCEAAARLLAAHTWEDLYEAQGLLEDIRARSAERPHELQRLTLARRLLTRIREVSLSLQETLGLSPVSDDAES
jgi:hypothetical protein